MNKFEKFDELSLPPTEAFRSCLIDEGISSDHYAHAQAMWNAFSIKNLEEYHDIYVKVVVIHFVDVFQSFRGLCRSYYDLDCGHVMKAPGLAWPACLKMYNEPLELLSKGQFCNIGSQGARKWLILSPLIISELS